MLSDYITWKKQPLAHAYIIINAPLSNTHDVIACTYVANKYVCSTCVLSTKRRVGCGYRGLI